MKWHSKEVSVTDNFRLIRSDRKTLSIQITDDGQVVVRCPRRLSQSEVDRFVRSKEAWIRRHLQTLQTAPQDKFTAEQLRRLAESAKSHIPARVAHFAPMVGVTYGSITIRAQHTRWGSCSGKGNLNFNCLLMLTPPEVLDYVVVHELCHRKEMNHSRKFWAQVEQILPDCKSHRAWLRKQGPSLIRRLP